MDAKPIYLVRGDGLKKMLPVRPENEADPQDLIESYPDLIGEEEGDLLLLKREQSNDGGSLDHLYVSVNAIPVLVEVKRWENAEIRRKIVAQMLDYAANNWATWDDGDAERLFRERCLEIGAVPESVFENFSNSDSSCFWLQVDQNMRDGRMKLLFVADEIPESLRRIIEFLNDQGMRCDVQAVALNYFRSEDGLIALAPTRYGQTEQTQARRASARSGLLPISIDEWLDRHIGDDGTEVRKGASIWIDIMNELGATVGVTDQQGSIYAQITNSDGKKVYPLYIRNTGRGEICFFYNHKRGRLVDEGLRRRILLDFEHAVGPLTSENLKGWPAFSLERLADSTKSNAFTKAAQNWIDICRNASKKNDL